MLIFKCCLNFDFCRTRQASVTAAAAAAAAAPETQTTTANPTGMDLDIPVDPNEPTYCSCNQVSYGEMVACDNPNVCITFFPIFSPCITYYIPNIHLCFDSAK